MSNDVATEQAYVSVLYRRLDDLRERAAGRLADVLSGGPTSHQERSQRDSTSTMYAAQIATYDAVENGLCFGRLDFSDGAVRYIGRIGIHDPSTDAEPLLLDWRAPAARPFYLATVAHPEGVSRRRHIHTHRRDVVGVDDEALDAAASVSAETSGLISEAPLIAALSADRTGLMRDIVSTIQREQDEIIRADRAGILVVGGGPGSGKTAVALHRAAYLLYHHRDTLASRGVLVVGPNSTFLRYIAQVLPGLGETAVVLSTVGGLLPGVTATATEPDAAAEIKGRVAMIEVLAGAVAEHERVPDEPWEVTAEDGEAVPLRPEIVAKVRDRVRGARLPHNAARPLFVRLMLDALADELADRVGVDPFGQRNLLGRADVAAIRHDLAGDLPVREAIEELWPALTPELVLAGLYGDPIALELAAPDLSAEERKSLQRRGSDHGLTVADVPLLDELAELLGTDDRVERARATAEAARRLEYAEGVMEILSPDAEFRDWDETLITDFIDRPEILADRQVEIDWRSLADKARADRQWVYGHVIVDEAQELSPMAWRMLMRRCPSRSMTLVGDLAQTSAPSGTSSWSEVLSPYVADRWRMAELTINYRTPAEIMAVAYHVLRAIDPAAPAPTSIRSVGEPPWRRRVTDIAAGVAGAVDAELEVLGDGRLAVLAPEDCLVEVCAALPDAARGDDADLTARVVVLTVRQAKGLEFDTVLVVEPARMLDRPRGHGDLYVALTRATKRLGVLHTGEIPEVLGAAVAV